MRVALAFPPSLSRLGVIVCLVTAQRGWSQAVCTESYFPLTPGDHWSFSFVEDWTVDDCSGRHEEGTDRGEFVIDIPDYWVTVNGACAREFKQTSEGEHVYSGFYSQDSAGLWLHREIDPGQKVETYRPPLLQIPSEVEPGGVHSYMHEGTMVTRETIGFEPITVGAGSFSALRSEIESVGPPCAAVGWSLSHQSSQIEWLVEGVGIVRYESNWVETACFDGIACGSATGQEVIELQSFSVPGRCPADIDSSGDVDFADLLAVLVNWGPCPLYCCPEDVDGCSGDGEVGFADLLTVLFAWGQCR